MYDPFKGYMQSWALLFSAVNAYTEAAIRMWWGALQGTQRFWAPIPGQRREDRHEPETCHKTGRRLDSEYGRRCRDVDVEHI